MNCLTSVESLIVSILRTILPWDMPVVLFSWTYDFWRWSDGSYPYDSYGKIICDTHIYTGGSDNVDEVLGYYDGDLAKIQDF